MNLKSHLKPGLEGRHTKVLEVESKNRRRLKNLNKMEEIRLQQRMHKLQSDLQAEESRQNRAVALVNRRLLDIKTYQAVLRDKYSMETVYNEHSNDYDMTASSQSLRREMNRKRKELDPDYQQTVMRRQRIDRLKQQNKVIPFDRNLSSLTTVLQTYSKTRGRSVLKPKGVIVTLNGAKRSHSFTEPAFRDPVKKDPTTFRSDHQ